MNSKEGKMLTAAEIVGKPAVLDSIQWKMQLVRDLSNSGRLDNLNRAIVLMAEKGWKPFTMAVSESSRFVSAYVLMVRE